MRFMGFFLSSAFEMQKISLTLRSLIGALSMPMEGKLAKHTRTGVLLWDKRLASRSTDSLHSSDSSGFINGGSTGSIGFRSVVFFLVATFCLPRFVIGSILAIDVAGTLVVASSVAASGMALDLLGLVVASLVPASKTGSVLVLDLLDLVTAPARVPFSVMSPWLSCFTRFLFRLLSFAMGAACTAPSSRAIGS